jgi:hypothetical protein
MVSDTELTVKVVNDNSITLILAGPDQMETSLVRCSM